MLQQKLASTILVLLCASSLAPAQVPVPEPFTGSTNASSESAVSAAPIRAVTPVALPERKFQWNSALRESGIFLGLQHAFRIATEPQTRENLSGPFLRDWFHSVGSIHGWKDGDPHFVNYLGHPIQGGVTGFISIQNDPRYRKAEFGLSREYWIGRLRASAFTAIYSLQFEIGPLSEASLGNVQGAQGQNGIVDWVITPTLGTVWMITEDALDKHVIGRIEGKVRNPVVRILVRGWLNPTRSFSNMLRFELPWHRDNRPGVTVD